MRSFENIQYEVGPWSLENFGHQETPYLTAVVGKCHTGSRALRRPLEGVEVRLGSMAPLMGLSEELGELFESGTNTDTKDAVGDLCIYLCDYCCREGIVIPYRSELDRRDIYDPGSGLVVYLGRLNRAHLKRHQGIRDMDNDVKFAAARLAAVGGFVFHLDLFVKEHLAGNGEKPLTNLVTILNETWNNIVKKRDWKADAAEGGGHTHTPAKDDPHAGTIEGAV